jgi:hypothetical protein
MEKNFFIVGMPRAGTTYLSKLLNMHSQIASSGETLFFGRLYFDPENGVYTKEQISYWLNRFKTQSFDNLSKDERRLLNANLELEFEKLKELCSPKYVFESLSNAFKKTSNKTFFIEKTPHHIQYVDRILSFYPEAKFIILIRDPYKWLLSYKFQGSQKDEKVRNVFKKIYHPLFASLVWRKNYISVQAALNKNSEKCLVIKNEDLNNIDTNKKVQSFIDIEFEDLSLEHINSSFSKINKPKLNAIDVFWMNVIAKKQIKESGYQSKKGQISPYLFIKSIFQMVPAAFYVVKFLPANKNIFIYLFNYLKK